MGFGGAIAGLAGSLISAGVGAAGSAGLFGGGPNLGEYSGRLNELANRYILPFARDPGYFDLNIPGLAQQGINFGLQYAPQLNAFNMAQLQGLLGQALPGYQGMVGQMATNVGQLLGGQVPTDVQQQIQRSAAYRSLIGGTAGAGTGMTGAITARDLGLTSLDLTGRGFTEASNLLQLSRNYLMPQPVNPLSLLPLSDLIQGTEWQKEAAYKANLAAYTAKANAAAAAIGAPSQRAAGIGGAIGDIGGILSRAFGKGGPFSGAFGGGGGDGFSIPESGVSGLSSSDISSLIGGGFTSGGLDIEDLGALGYL